MNRARVIAVTFLILALLSPALRGDNAKDAVRQFERARAADRDKRYDEALEAIQQAIQLDPNHPGYHGMAGWINLQKQDYAAGLRASEAAIRLANGRHDAFFLFLAGENAYYDQDLDLATKYLKQAAAQEKELGAGNAAIARERLDLLSEKTYDFEVRVDPKRAPSLKRGDGTFTLPVPATTRWAFQKLNRVTVIGARSHKMEEIEGNDVVVLTPEGNEPMRVLVNVTVKPFSFKARLSRRTRAGAYSELVKPYLGASEWMNPQSRILQKVVEPLRKPDSLDTVAAIVAYLRKELRYIPNENLQNAGDVTVETTLARGQASCHGWSAAFAGLCRAAGVPARMVVVLSAKERDRFEYHDIVEVYIPNCGWVPVEPQPAGVTGMPGTQLIRLYHYTPTRQWGVNNPEKIHLFNIFTALNAERHVAYNMSKR
jgi:tetratricopeptide (TPR) repeat protein